MPFFLRTIDRLIVLVGLRGAGKTPVGQRLANRLRLTATRADGAPIAPNDPQWDQVSAAALAARFDPGIWLDQEAIYGAVGRAARFREAFSSALESLWKRGLPTTLKSYAEGTA